MPHSPLLLDGLIEFNRQKWGFVPERVRLSADASGVPAIETVYYTDRHGRIVHPRIGTYIPVAFTSTPTESPTRLGRQWLSVAGLMAEDMHQRGLAGAVPLAPEATDVRPWQWDGFRVGVRYTYQLDFPYDEKLAEPAVRRQIAKAARNGFRVERTRNFNDLLSCLEASAGRKHFEVEFGVAELTLLDELLGEEHLRPYVCYAPDGEPACGGVMLHVPGGRALYWVFGTKTTFMSAGATQFAIRNIIDDLTAAGATGIDFLGAQLASVAAMKATWGSRLTPYYRVDGGRVRAIARHVKDDLRFRRAHR